jgi:hypothetical protein
MQHFKNSVSVNVLSPMPREKAEMLARRLTGAYPSLKLHDPEIFVAELIASLLRYPAWVGEQAIEQAKRASPQFVPSVPMVTEACESVVGQTREAMTYAHEWEEQSRRQLAQRKEQEAAEIESLEYRRRAAERILAEYRAGVSSKRMQTIETPETVKAKYGLSEQQWGAIPESPIDRNYWQGLRTAADGVLQNAARKVVDDSRDPVL